jgi:uncharacterized repeat protein (TIGR03803 family)
MFATIAEWSNSRRFPPRMVLNFARHELHWLAKVYTRLHGTNAGMMKYEFSLLVLFGIFFTGATAAVNAQTVTVIASFDYTNGSGPFAPLVQGIDGNFYGTAPSGGHGYGTIFTASPLGGLKAFLAFEPPGAYDPQAGFLPYPNGTFYGTTAGGGTNGHGTLFQLTPSGAITTLHNFNLTSGAVPLQLVLGANGTIYGTAAGGGPNDDGTIFQLKPNGTFSTLHTFSGSDGSSPTILIAAANGVLYGTTNAGALYSSGSIYSITLSGVFTTLYDFNNTNGAVTNSFVQASDGDFYGTTSPSDARTYGSIFKITGEGTFTTLHTFDVSGAYGPSSLVQGTDGNFYGTTAFFGLTGGDGTIFRMTPSGEVTTVYTFNSADRFPSGLVQGTDGNFYGVTAAGGTSGYGTVFRLSLGLSPFVRTLPLSGKVGSEITILGTNLAGATTVTFGGVPAAFSVTSASALSASVPSGAKTGAVQVTSPSGTLSSNVAFHVR